MTDEYCEYNMAECDIMCVLCIVIYSHTHSERDIYFLCCILHMKNKNTIKSPLGYKIIFEKRKKEFLLKWMQKKLL